MNKVDFKLSGVTIAFSTFPPLGWNIPTCREKKTPTFCRMIGIEHTDYPEVPTSIF